MLEKCIYYIYSNALKIQIFVYNLCVCKYVFICVLKAVRCDCI